MLHKNLIFDDIRYIGNYRIHIVICYHYYFEFIYYDDKLEFEINIILF